MRLSVSYGQILGKRFEYPGEKGGRREGWEKSDGGHKGGR